LKNILWNFYGILWNNHKKSICNLDCKSIL
jgi:hypothetical protein